MGQLKESDAHSWWCIKQRGYTHHQNVSQEGDLGKVGPPGASSTGKQLWMTLDKHPILLGLLSYTFKMQVKTAPTSGSSGEDL